MTAALTVVNKHRGEQRRHQIDEASLVLGTLPVPWPIQVGLRLPAGVLVSSLLHPQSKKTDECRVELQLPAINLLQTS